MMVLGNRRRNEEEDEEVGSGTYRGEEEEEEEEEEDEHEGDGKQTKEDILDEVCHKAWRRDRGWNHQIYMTTL